MLLHAAESVKQCAYLRFFVVHMSALQFKYECWQKLKKNDQLKLRNGAHIAHIPSALKIISSGC